MWSVVIPNSSINVLQGNEQLKYKLTSQSKFDLPRIIRPSLNLFSESVRHLQSECYRTDNNMDLVTSLHSLKENNPQLDTSALFSKSETMLGHGFGHSIPFQVPSLTAEELKPPMASELYATETRGYFRAFSLFKELAEWLYNRLYDKKMEKSVDDDLKTNMNYFIQPFEKPPSTDMSFIGSSINGFSDKLCDSLLSEGYESDNKSDSECSSLADMLKATMICSPSPTAKSQSAKKVNKMLDQPFETLIQHGTNLCKLRRDSDVDSLITANPITCDKQKVSENIIPCVVVKEQSNYSIGATIPRRKRKAKKKGCNKDQENVKIKKQASSDAYTEPLEILRVGGARRVRRKRRSSNKIPKNFCDYTLKIPKPSSSGCQRLYGPSNEIVAEELDDDDEILYSSDWDKTDDSIDFEIVFDCFSDTSCGQRSSGSPPETMHHEISYILDGNDLYEDDSESICSAADEIDDSWGQYASDSHSQAVCHGISYILSGNDDIYEDDCESVCSAADEMDNWEQQFKETFETFQFGLLTNDLTDSVYKPKDEAAEEDLIISTVEERNLRDFETDMILKEVNQRWRDDMKDVEEKSQEVRLTKVRFAPDEELEEVREFEKCAEEDSENDWYLYKLMRCRFAKRISEIEPVISPCLSKHHRDNILKKISYF